MKRIVILGAGTGGTLAANRLRRELHEQAEIVVVDQDDRHVYQPGLLFVPFGLTDPADIVRPRHEQLHHDVEFRIDAVDRVDVTGNIVHLEQGGELPYDVLVVATGARLLPEETEGLLGPGWRQDVFDFYTPDGAVALRDRLADFKGGRLVVNAIEMPIKCPVAPLEFCFLADWFLRERGVRHHTELTYVTSLDAAFTKPIAAEHLGGMLTERDVRIETEFATGTVDAPEGRLISWDEREVGFDLLVTIPLHGGAAFVDRSEGLGDELGFVVTDPHTLQAAAAPNVFALGDATNLPASKAGSVTHFEGETLVRNIEHLLEGEPLEPTYDGHANCFIETGFHKALNIDFDYEAEPVPGKPTRLNHLGKLVFQPLYWHVLLPGREIPGAGLIRKRQGAAR